MKLSTVRTFLCAENIGCLCNTTNIAREQQQQQQHPPMMPGCEHTPKRPIPHPPPPLNHFSIIHVALGVYIHTYKSIMLWFQNDDVLNTTQPIHTSEALVRRPHQPYAAGTQYMHIVQDTYRKRLKFESWNLSYVYTHACTVRACPVYMCVYVFGKEKKRRWIQIRWPRKPIKIRPLWYHIYRTGFGRAQR